MKKIKTINDLEKAFKVLCTDFKAEKGSEGSEQFIAEFNGFLDDLADEDFFGTEQQLDPRRVL